MHSLKITAFSISCLFLAASCNPLSDDSESDLFNKQQEVSPYAVNLINHIFGNEGTFRGFELGEEFHIIKEKEDLEQFEETDDEYAYTFETDNDEIVDIYYSHLEGELNEVLVDIYLNTDSLTAEMASGISQFLTIRYGHPEVDSLFHWEINETDKVQMKVVKKELDHGLQVTYSREKP
ncbi:hypothetical protein [Jiulongibacter sp. NS-SX5]|uniref:hypothetical protein n=1 Tax=Jiulongibacter sp. NS-SX5 TaxID=3463854 RepID=UPI0040595791